MEKTLVSQRKGVGESFSRKEAHVRTGLKEGKPRNEFGRVNGSVCHKGR